MRTNAVKQALEAGEVVIGTMIDEVRSPAIAEIFVTAGFDFFFIDMEHGAYDLITAADIMKAARLAGITPLVRVPDARYHPKGRILDSGALGLMLPRVRTYNEVEEFVAEVKYPPLGCRGCFVTGANNDYAPQSTDTFIEEANQETLVIVQVELEEAIENIDAILSVSGVDVAMLGLGDLSVSLGVPGQSKHAKVVEAADRVIEACNRHSIVPAIHLGNTEALVEWMHKGVRMITWSTDIWMLLNSGRDAVRRLRSGMAKLGTSVRASEGGTGQ